MNKNYTKAFSVAAALMFAAGVGVVTANPVHAAQITIENPADGQTYAAYQLFAADSTGRVFTATDDQKDALNITRSPFVFSTERNSAGTWNVTFDSSLSAEDIVEFIKGKVDLSKLKSSSFTNGVASNLDSGYYYVTSTAGSVVMLQTATGDVTIKDKNDIQFEKTADDKEITDYAVGDTVPFTITFKAYKGWENVTVTDTMSEGLDLDFESIQVKGTTQAFEKTETKVGQTTTGFTLTFAGPFATDATVTITYNAKVNNKAVFNENETNKATLQKDNNTNIGNDTVTIYNYDLTINKFDNADKTVLAGAEFQIYKENPSNDSATPLYFAPVSEDGVTVYTIAKEGDDGATQTLTTPATGTISIRGLDDITYYVKETKAPEGYNLMEGIKTFKPSAQTVGTASNTKLDVPNNKGQNLPSTGGMGTTLMYTVGGMMVVGAAAIYVTKKRTNA
ncbi:SpaH/EbpB family LPXTG-anchored major pilin [Faecalibaculum rodentium]|uniref:SpaH/EbpB family LPXTG-anchored major pilin n=2 Tax=Faecalibaculum rodentium TaxID=1702221 RepID=UPI0025B77BD6|nr:SpaH/EbpB family LPXTG-anchored major pilin [Faecalibaculum rodentium]